MHFPRDEFQNHLDHGPSYLRISCALCMFFTTLYIRVMSLPCSVHNSTAIFYTPVSSNSSRKNTSWAVHSANFLTGILTYTSFPSSVFTIKHHGLSHTHNIPSESKTLPFHPSISHPTPPHPSPSPKVPNLQTKGAKVNTTTNTEHPPKNTWSKIQPRSQT